MMKKKKTPKMTPTEAAQFLESLRLLQSQIDQPKKMISIRIPENLLNIFKSQAKLQGKKYQNLIVESMRAYIRTF